MTSYTRRLQSAKQKYVPFLPFHEATVHGVLILDQLDSVKVKVTSPTGAWGYGKLECCKGSCDLRL